MADILPDRICLPISGEARTFNRSHLIDTSRNGVTSVRPQSAGRVGCFAHRAECDARRGTSESESVRNERHARPPQATVSRSALAHGRKATGAYAAREGVARTCK